MRQCGLLRLASSSCYATLLALLLLLPPSSPHTRTLQQKLSSPLSTTPSYPHPPPNQNLNRLRKQVGGGGGSRSGNPGTLSGLEKVSAGLARFVVVLTPEGRGGTPEDLHPLRALLTTQVASLPSSHPVFFFEEENVFFFFVWGGSFFVWGSGEGRKGEGWCGRERVFECHAVLRHSVCSAEALCVQR
eukprot:1405010-Rhodomonas_salina.1